MPMIRLLLALPLTLPPAADALPTPRPALAPNPGGALPSLVVSPAEAAAELRAWRERNAAQLAAVEEAWAALLRRMSGFRPAEFDRQCEDLATSLARLDESILLPAPDRLVDLYVRRLATHLHGAVAACRTGTLFNVVYHLGEARTALGEMRWLVAQRTRQPTAAPR